MKCKLTILIIVTLSLILAPVGSTQPRIIVFPLEFDPFLFDEDGEIGIDIENQGDEDLIFNIDIVYQEDAENDYLMADPENGVVEPEGELGLSVFYRYGLLQEGHNNAEILINSNDPEHETVVFRFHAYVYWPYLDIELAEGWNLISSYYSILHINSMEYIWREQVERDELIIAKDGEGRFFLPAFDFNNIPLWNFREGYLAKMAEASTLQIDGEPVEADTPIPLDEGWSMIAYFPEEEIEAPEAFRNIEDVLIQAKDGEGRFYLPEQEFNNMQPLRRGLGYMVKVTEEIELIWNNR